MSQNEKSGETAEFDFIVVGSGMSGGWVAKELCERGFKVAVVERGREIKPKVDYTDFEDPWDHEHLNMRHMGETNKKDYPIQSEVYAFQKTLRRGTIMLRNLQAFQAQKKALKSSLTVCFSRPMT